MWAKGRGPGGQEVPLVAQIEGMACLLMNEGHGASVYDLSSLIYKTAMEKDFTQGPCIYKLRSIE